MQICVLFSNFPIKFKYYLGICNVETIAILPSLPNLRVDLQHPYCPRHEGHEGVMESPKTMCPRANYLRPLVPKMNRRRYAMSLH